MLKKLIFKSMALVLLLPTLSACTGVEKKLKVSLSDWPGYEYLWLAKENGYLEQFEFIEYTDLSEATLGYLRGEVDIAQLTTIDVAGICSRSESMCPTIILVINESLGGDKIMSKKLDKVDQLKGKKIGVSTNSFGPYVLARALENSNVDFTDVQLKPMQLPDMPLALQNGDVDAIALYPPYSEKARKIGAIEIFDSSQIPGEILDVLVVSPSVLINSPLKLSQLIVGWYKAHQDVLREPEKYIPLMARREGLTNEEFEQILLDLKFDVALDRQAELLSKDDSVDKNIQKVKMLLEQLSLIEVSQALPDVDNGPVIDAKSSL